MLLMGSLETYDMMERSLEPSRESDGWKQSTEEKTHFSMKAGPACCFDMGLGTIA